MVADGEGKSQISTLATLDMSSGAGRFKYQTQSSVHVGVARAITRIAVVKNFFTPVQATNFIHVLGKVLGKLWVDVVVVFTGNHWVFRAIRFGRLEEIGAVWTHFVKISGHVGIPLVVPGYFYF